MWKSIFLCPRIPPHNMSLQTAGRRFFYLGEKGLSDQRVERKRTDRHTSDFWGSPAQNWNTIMIRNHCVTLPKDYWYKKIERELLELLLLLSYKPRDEGSFRALLWWLTFYYIVSTNLFKHNLDNSQSEFRYPNISSKKLSKQQSHRTRNIKGVK